MPSNLDYQEQLVGLLRELAVEEGLQETAVTGVQLFRGSQSVPRGPMVYCANIIIVGQGQKRAYLDGQVYQYDPFNYLVSAVPLPAECEAIATPDEPILMVNIDVDMTMVGEMILEMDESLPSGRETPRGISTTPMSDELAGAVIRLLQCLKSPVDSRLLGRQIVREVVYRVLRGEQGGSLRALASRDDHFPRIARVLKYLHTEYALPISTDDMAKRAAMSSSVFHQHFKLVTASSPLQYLKRIRLDRARSLMIHEGYQAREAALAVGYESPSQFSREFKRLFGRTPLEDTEQMRKLLLPDGAA